MVAPWICYSALDLFPTPYYQGRPQRGLLPAKQVLISMWDVVGLRVALWDPEELIVALHEVSRALWGLPMQSPDPHHTPRGRFCDCAYFMDKDTEGTERAGGPSVTEGQSWGLNLGLLDLETYVLYSAVVLVLLK